MRLAFSSIACPELTIADVAELASSGGYQGVELRTFGHASVDLACDPSLTAPHRVRSMFDDAGADVMCLASSIRYDAPVNPPVVGHLFCDFEASVRETKSLIELAARMECPFVRVFGFQLPERERRANGLERVLKRLDLSLRCARHTGVRLLIENGGTFSRAEDLAEIVDRAESPLLGTAYSPAVGMAAGDDPVHAVSLLRDSLQSIKLTDIKGDRPVPLGEGDVPNEAVVRALADTGYGGWLVYEWPRLWLPELGDPRDVIHAASDRLYNWAGARVGRLAGSTAS